MAAGDIVLIHGTNSFAIGLQGYTYSNVKVRNATLEPCSEEKLITGEQKETLEVLIVNPGDRVKLTGAVLAAALSDIQDVKKGDAISINGVSMCVEDFSCKYIPAGEIMFDVTAIKEDSMTYT